MIASNWLPLLLLATLPLCEALLREKEDEEEVPMEKWECGSDHKAAWVFGGDKAVARNEIMRSCPHFAAELNHCCVVHDACYGRQKGQELCDTLFAECGKKVLEDERAGPCAEHAERAIGVLRRHGWMAYDRSKDYVEPDESALPQLCRPEKTIGVFFDYLYLSCRTFKKPISSCCDQLILCPDLPLGRNRTECANRAMVCLSEVRTEEPPGFNDGHCDRALNRTKKYLALDYILEEAYHRDHSQMPQIFAHSRQAFALLMLLSMMCGLGLLLVTYKYYRLRSEMETRQ